MIFFVDIPDATFQRAMVNRQTVAKCMQTELRALSPLDVPPYSGDDPEWEDYVFNQAKVTPIDRETEEILRNYAANLSASKT